MGERRSLRGVIPLRRTGNHTQTHEEGGQKRYLEDGFVQVGGGDGRGVGGGRCGGGGGGAAALLEHVEILPADAQNEGNGGAGEKKCVRGQWAWVRYCEREAGGREGEVRVDNRVDGRTCSARKGLDRAWIGA